MSYEQFFREAQKSKQGVPSAPKATNKGTQASSKSFTGELRSGLSPEELVKAHFANAKAKTQADRKARRKRSKPPVFASLLLLIAIASGVTGYLRPDLAERIPTIELGFFGEADASEKVDAKTKPDAPVKEKAIEPKEAKKSAESADSSQPTAEVEKTPDVKQWTAEEISFFKKLGERKESLDRREAELVKLEEELQKQKKGLDERIHQLESMRKEISTTLKDRVVLDQEKVAKLVDVYSNMKPTQAARVIETLNEDLAVTILDRLKKKNAAEILNAMSAAKAKRLSEMLTGYETVANADASKK
ncbi:MAG: hypothetical protein IPJ84_12915 [Bdellovibrionales bacterium]|nr:hypothetical protein [Bdellovibrionales bacterium]